jgi:hypothetical protein
MSYLVYKRMYLQNRKTGITFFGCFQLYFQQAASFLTVISDTSKINNQQKQVLSVKEIAWKGLLEAVLHKDDLVAPCKVQCLRLNVPLVHTYNRQIDLLVSKKDHSTRYISPSQIYPLRCDLYEICCLQKLLNTGKARNHWCSYNRIRVTRI